MSEARDIPILFAGAMVRGILADRKTMTRRILKPQPDERLWPILARHPNQISMTRWRGGDRLWVRETWGCLAADHPLAISGRKPTKGDEIIYRADPWSAAQWAPGLPSQGSFVWRPSIHMPRWASRITLEVTAVRVERLQDISEADAIAEGAEPILVPPDGGSSPHIEGFRELWTHINGADSWSANPWVSVTTFQRQPNSGAGRGEM